MKRANVVDNLSIMMMAKREDVENAALMFISKADDINVTGRDGRTLLIHSSLYNYPNLVKTLIEHKADINIQDNKGYSPLHAAVMNRNRQIVEMLLENGADPNLIDQNGNNPSFYVGDNTDILKLLLHYKCNVHNKNIYGISSFELLMMNPSMKEILNSLHQQKPE
ncbi:MAG: ankyrin repeat domain-containing protein [Clostridia bacterium]|nr:ankyrin repeat domain-containing protein [Clostridia bacterium]